MCDICKSNDFEHRLILKVDEQDDILDEIEVCNLCLMTNNFLIGAIKWEETPQI